MPRFIPIQLFQGLYQSFSDLLTEDGIDAFIKNLNTVAAQGILKKEKIFRFPKILKTEIYFF